MSVINTNVNAVLAQNSLVKNERAMSSAMEQLSTGKRINTAADDAAGMAIASKMTSQIRGLDQAVRNVNDAVSMIQTAEGATGEITNMLQRMRELSVQAATGTNTASDVGNIESEFNALLVGIDNIADTTQWNQGNILDGNARAVTFQIGANTGQSMLVNLGNLQSNAFAAGTAGTAAVATTAGEAANMTSFTVGGITVNSTALLAATSDGDVRTALLADTEFARRYTIGAASGTGFTITEKAGFETVTGPVVSTTGTTVATAVTTVAGVEGTLGLGANISGLTSTTTGVITTLDNALAAVAKQRASHGAAINRLEYTADNLLNVSQNTQASRSRIEDADYAKATTELARTQIIQQAGTAMLAQANQQSQGVLALLQ
jgi:flagellin